VQLLCRCEDACCRHLYAGLIVLLVVACGCFPHRSGEASPDPPGFFMGIWHGWIAPLSLIIGFFHSDIRVYETNNSGWWYDLGFYIAIISGFGGISFFRKEKHDHGLKT
jgi:hypothetical protein